MKIIILGAGEVGGKLAVNLGGKAKSEGYEITLVDTSSTQTSIYDTQYDIKTVAGHACSVSVLAEAGAENADMIVATTNNDEVNMAACRVATHMFNVRRTIARVRSPEYYTKKDEIEKLFNISVMINPEHSVANYVHNLIKYPYVRQVATFAHNVAIVALCADQRSTLAGKRIAQIQQELDLKTSCVLLLRHEKPIPLIPNSTIQINDEVYLLMLQDDMQRIMQKILPNHKRNRRIAIVGGGHVGVLLAKRLQYQYKVKLIERDPEKCANAALQCPNALVIKGSGNDLSLLKQEVGHSDIMCALTNIDEVNVTACMLAKQCGVKRVIALLNNDAYLDLIEDQKLPIDVSFSPQDLVLSTFLSHIHPNELSRVRYLHHGLAEAIQVNIAKGSQTSNFIGTAIADLTLPKEAYVAAVVHKRQLVFALDDWYIEENDCLIIILTNPDCLEQINTLFGAE